MEEFSFYEKGLKSKKPTKNLMLYEVCEYIKSHPQKDKIRYLRSLSKTDNKYNAVKGGLPCITPHGIYGKSKSVSDIVEISGYMYLDIDDKSKEEIESIKNNLLSNFRKYIAMMGVSAGGRGMYMYIKVKGLTAQNFNTVQQYFIRKIFNDYDIDTKATGIHRCHILSYDEQVYYYYKPEPFTIPDRVLQNIKNTTDSVYRTKEEMCYTLPSVYRDIREVWSKLVLETEVDTGNKLFVIEPVDFYKLHIPKIIQDGKKHSAYRGITNTLLILNPKIELIDVLSFMNYVNFNHSDYPMKEKEMVRTVSAEYQRIKETGEIFAPYNTKVLHFHKSKDISRLEKIRTANKVNGLIRTFITLRKVISAKEQLIEEGRIKLRNKDIALLSGVSKDTVSRYKNLTLKEVVTKINSYNRKVLNGVLDSRNRDQSLKE